MYISSYIAAPMIAMVFAITSISVIPFGNWLTVGPGAHTSRLRLEHRAAVVLALLDGVYGVALAGWSSNNKYSLLADCAPARR